MGQAKEGHLLKMPQGVVVHHRLLEETGVGEALAVRDLTVANDPREVVDLDPQDDEGAEVFLVVGLGLPPEVE